MHAFTPYFCPHSPSPLSPSHTHSPSSPPIQTHPPPQKTEREREEAPHPHLYCLLCLLPRAERHKAVAPAAPRGVVPHHPSIAAPWQRLKGLQVDRAAADGFELQARSAAAQGPSCRSTLQGPQVAGHEAQGCCPCGKRVLKEGSSRWLHHSEATCTPEDSPSALLRCTYYPHPHYPQPAPANLSL